MKGLSILAAFLGGAVVGAAAGIYLLLKAEKTLVAKLLMLYVKRYQIKSHRYGKSGR